METAKNLLELGPSELLRRAAALKATLAEQRLALQTGTARSPAAHAAQRRDLARIYTVLTQKARSESALKAPIPEAP